MTMMNNSPAEQVDHRTEIIIDCTHEESAHRLEQCSSCVNFSIDEDQHTKCVASGCNISLMISLKFKQCPLQKW